MSRPDASVHGARRPVVLLTALWFGIALASAGPGLLLLGLAERRLASPAAMALLLAGIVAAGSGVLRPRRHKAVGHGRPGGRDAVLAGALTRRGPSR